MARQTDAYHYLKKIVGILEKELEDPKTSVARRRTVQRQYLQASLSLSKLEQLQARLKLQNAKPAPVVKEPPQSHLERWLEEAEGDTSDARNILGGPAESPSDPTSDDEDPDEDEDSEDDDSEDEDGDPSPPEIQVEGDAPEDPKIIPSPPALQVKEAAIDPEVLEAWVQLRTFKQERAERLRAQTLALPGELPAKGRGQRMWLDQPNLSEAALRVLDSILPGGAFDSDAPTFILHDVLAYLKEMEHLTSDEKALKMELEFMTAEERERLSRSLAAACRNER